LRAGSQFINNPFIPLFQRQRPIFDFDQQISINFNNNANNSGGGTPGNFGGLGNRGTTPQQAGGLEELRRLATGGGNLGGINRNPYREKMGILGNFDTKSAFNFENQFKLNFKSDPEDILQSLEAGNVSFPVRSQLVPGVENLFGVKAGLRFGKLDVTTVVAQQRSRTESILINGGAQNRPFEIRVDQYDENRHFFLAHFFREQYEKNLRNLPMITSGVIITRLEVYITNRTNTVNSMRNLVGLTDLGEASPYNPQILKESTQKNAYNDVNRLGDILKNNSFFRKIDNTNGALEAEQLNKGIDFEILRGAKRLTEREFDFNQQLGYISLLTPLRNDEVLAVAYEYTYNGRSYKVGELTEDYAFREEDDVIALKLLKASTIRNRLTHPMWNLMMKNVYSLNQAQIDREGFQLRIIYKDDATGMDTPNLHEGKNLQNIPLISVMNLDRLNYNNDPQPDGNFDYVEGITINPQRGTIIFPVLEPFGSFLESKFEAEEELLKRKYVFNELYERTLTDAQQVNTKNKFFLQGSVQSNSSEIPLPLGASGGSVRVYSGGTELQQGIDYQVDQQFGRIRIINPSILASGRTIRVDYERPDLFQSQIRRLFGLRLDYTVNRYLRIGGTLMDLRENTPGFLTRTAIGNEPVNNTLWGLDVNLKKEGNGLTRLLDKLPMIQTKEPSAILLNAEFAQLMPGVNNKKINGNSMIDDFEASRNINDLARQPQRWRLGSTPEKFKVDTSSIYGYNYRRAKMSVYTIDQSTFLNNAFGGGGLVPPELTQAAQSNIYERAYLIQDIFPGRSRPVLGQNLPTATLDVSYFPEERGMYNYNPRLTTEGFLENPKQNFGAVQRGITFDADFDNSNVEYLEFWLLDPFKGMVRDGRRPDGTQNTTGGKLVFHLGDVSEDVIPDGRFNFENGIPTDTLAEPVITPWGKTGRSQFITDAFDNNEQNRKKQDVGLEGLSNEEEKEFPHIKAFLDNVRNNVSSAAYEAILKDPSGDDFKFFLDQDFNSNQYIVERFKNYLGMENNAPVVKANETITPASTATADKEDINQDNTINDVESYHEYKVDLQSGKLEIGSGFIIDKVSSGEADWYQFRIPLRTTEKGSVGDISGFKSIRFMRMVLEEWEQPVVLRFAALQLIANQYRVYTQDLNNHDFVEKPETYDAKVKATTVSIEENGCDEDGNCNIKPGQTPYVVPPGFIRDRDFSQQIFRQFNEQSLSLSVDGLRAGDKRGIFKNTKLDLNMYKRLQMFIHAQNPKDEDRIGGAFIRLGTDVKTNYYEIEIANLKTTPTGSQNPEVIWPGENEIDIPLDFLRDLKVERNMALGKDSVSLNRPYFKTILVPGISGSGENIVRTYNISVVGNPDLSAVLTLMLGVSNPDKSTNATPASFTVWMNELRANGFDETKGEAGVLAADIKLADLGNISISGNFSTFGFGGVQDRISNRSRSNSVGFGIASTLELDRFFPQKWGMSIPLFMNYDKQQVTPHFNPLDPDIVLDRALNAIQNPAERQRFKDMVIDHNINRGFNLANVRKTKTNLNAKNHVYDIENFTFSYAQSSINRKNILIDEYISERKRGAISYQFQPKKINWEPFKSSENLSKPSSSWLKDFNFSPLPSLIAFRTDFDRNFTKTQYRNSDLSTDNIAPNYIKYFLLNRYYDVQWDLSKSLALTYNAHMSSIIDEPFDTEDEKIVREQIWKNLKKFGRAKNYTQTVQATYRVPLQKFFLLDWIQADTRFNAGYRYRANAYTFLGFDSNGNRDGFTIKDANGISFGNFIDNNRELAVQGRIDMVKLYNKLRYLKFANSPNQSRERFTRSPGDDEEILLPSSDVLKTFTRLLMTVRGINFNYSIVQSTILPGVLFEPKFFGMSNAGNPGLPFILGAQNYNNSIHERAFREGWLSTSTERYDPFIQTRQKKFDFSTNLEPFTGFRMQIRGNYTRGDSYQEMFGMENGMFSPQNPYRNGTFSMSFWSFKTGFIKASKSPEDNYAYPIFEKMQANRSVVAAELNRRNASGENRYYDNSQDVLIPAFFAAYSGKSVDKLFAKADRKGQETFNPFLQFPLPNWRIDYTGLEKLPALKKAFQSITLSHSYSSTYSVGNFTSSLSYGQQWVNLTVNDYKLGNLETTQLLANGNEMAYFMPVFIMSNITMEERFSPLIGVNFTTKGSLSGRIEYNKERRASLNLSNSQVAEYNSNDFVIGVGLRKNNVKLPVKGRDGNNVVLTNDLNFRFDVTVRDITAIQRRLDGEAVPVQGNYNLQIKPQIAYQFNKRLNMTFYIERFVNTPFTTLSYATRRTVGGISMRFNLSD
jgi:cell surface protein SprA